MNRVRQPSLTSELLKKKVRNIFRIQSKFIKTLTELDSSNIRTAKTKDWKDTKS